MSFEDWSLKQKVSDGNKTGGKPDEKPDAAPAVLKPSPQPVGPADPIAAPPAGKP